MSGHSPVVAVFNSSADVVQLLRTALEGEGYTTATAHVTEIKQGHQDVVDFFERYDPQVVIYDISLPYAENWTFFKLIRDTQAAQGRRFIVTTPNKQALQAAIGESEALELVGKPYDLQTILDRVAAAVRAAAADASSGGDPDAGAAAR
jgi:DNA-binding response OmpR family regulator